MVNSLFFKAKSKRLSNIISIESPEAFRNSIRQLQDSNGLVSTKEKRALILAQNRARAILRKKNISSEEKTQFREITKIELPAIRRK